MTIGFRRESDGTYRAYSGPSYNPEYIIGQSEFQAQIHREGREWRANTQTHQLALHSSLHKTLDAAKESVRATEHAVNSV